MRVYNSVPTCTQQRSKYLPGGALAWSSLEPSAQGTPGISEGTPGISEGALGEELMPQ